MDMNSRHIDANGTVKLYATILFKRISQEASETSDGRTNFAAQDVARKSRGAI